MYYDEELRQPPCASWLLRVVYLINPLDYRLWLTERVFIQTRGKTIQGFNKSMNGSKTLHTVNHTEFMYFVQSL